MVYFLTLLTELLVSGFVFGFWYHLLWRRFNQIAKIATLLLCFCAGFISCSIGAAAELPKRTVTITALGQKCEQSDNSQVYLQDIRLDGRSVGIPDPVSGQWNRYYDYYSWFEEGDDRRQAETTETISFELDFAWEVKLVFMGNKWKGIVSIQADDAYFEADTYLDNEDAQLREVLLPVPGVDQVVKAVTSPLLRFTVALLALCAVLSIIIGIGLVLGKRLTSMCGEHGLFQKILRHQFLFEELVSRDFKKKYKRTVLGVGWSILSPLLTLLVMRVVFTQFFGRAMEHYTIYLFCGTLIFSYFNESTSQGMTSLIENVGIFTKVNVPKYLFLLSKNVQTLINFGLTLCVFFVFCIIDQVEFTWKFICLLYPMLCLVLFNIGVGLILSALHIFFRDIQYLWAVFTQLLMYVSAIFYTINEYDYTIQCLFLLNPIYLFIRYFRKIILDVSIPTVWFHLLMLADVAVVLGLGCWIYKKYNTRFLYYV